MPVLIPAGKRDMTRAEARDIWHSNTERFFPKHLVTGMFQKNSVNEEVGPVLKINQNWKLENLLRQLYRGT
jgi:hypothetical protein